MSVSWPVSRKKCDEGEVRRNLAASTWVCLNVSSCNASTPKSRSPRHIRRPHEGAGGACTELSSLLYT